MNGLLRKKIDISFLKKIDTRFGDSALWQFVKFNLVSFSITLQQLDWDVDAVCFAGFTEEELRQYRELEDRIGNRILHHLQAETAKES